MFPVAQDHLSALPDEILLHMCSFMDGSSLSKFAQINHRFAQLIRGEPQLWARLIPQLTDLYAGNCLPRDHYYGGSMSQLSSTLIYSMLNKLITLPEAIEIAAIFKYYQAIENLPNIQFDIDQVYKYTFALCGRPQNSFLLNLILAFKESNLRINLFDILRNKCWLTILKKKLMPISDIIKLAKWNIPFEAFSAGAIFALKEKVLDADDIICKLPRSTEDKVNFLLHLFSEESLSFLMERKKFAAAYTYQSAA